MELVVRANALAQRYGRAAKKQLDVAPQRASLIHDPSPQRRVRCLHGADHFAGRVAGDLERAQSPHLLLDRAREHDARHQDTGVIQPTPAPLGSISMAMRPTSGTSKIGMTRRAPALMALATRLSTSSTARKDIQLSGTPSNSGELSGKRPATGLPPCMATQ